LDNAILTMATEPAWAPVVARLGCLRGVGTLTGFGLAVEIGDWHRFTDNSIGSYLGLTPPEECLLGLADVVEFHCELNILDGIKADSVVLLGDCPAE
jgi:hypothetical protein